MAIYSIDQIKDIIINNPNKALIKKGRAANKKLMMHVHGVDIKSFIKRDDYFETSDAFKSRTDGIVSNKDLFTRVLHEESLIFAARGGSTHFNMPKTDEEAMIGLLANVRYGLPLREWIENFALPAYRTDPMGVFFMEVEQMSGAEGEEIRTPECYPTYKSIQCIYDYQPNGRRLEYICFQLETCELKDYGIDDKESGNLPVPATGDNAVSSKKFSQYFRFVDDEKDMIVKRDNNTIFVAINAKNPVVKNDRFGDVVPAFIISDLLQFNDPSVFASPLSFLIELSDCFMYDRSIRDLQKKYHGFAKAVEPLLKCATCGGTGQTKGSACPDCTLPGHVKGIGYKLRTKISDVSKFPLETLEKIPSFDFAKIYGYVTPPIETWNKQDFSLKNSEQMIYYSYWGCAQDMRTSGPDDTTGRDIPESATKTVANLKPKYARLNRTADWAQNTENIIASFIGRFWFEQSFKGSAIAYSRNYILETAEELIEQYYDMRSKGVPDFIMDEQIFRYLNCLYEDNPLQLAKFLKLFAVDPFPHDTPQEIDTSATIDPEQKLCKWYFGQWAKTLQDMYIIDTPAETLKADLVTYSTAFKVDPVEKESTAPIV